MHVINVSTKVHAEKPEYDSGFLPFFKFLYSVQVRHACKHKSTCRETFCDVPWKKVVAKPEVVETNTSKLLL